MNNFVTRLTIVTSLAVIIFANDFIPALLAGFVLASGLHPLLDKFPFSRLKSRKHRKLILLVSFLAAFGTLGTYVVVASARGIARNVDLKQMQKNERRGEHAEDKDGAATEDAKGNPIDEDTSAHKEQREVNQQAADASSQEATAIEGQAAETKEVGLTAGFVERAKKLMQKIPGMNAEQVTRTWSDMLRGARNLMIGFVSKILTAGPGMVIEWVVFILAFVCFFWGYQEVIKMLRSFQPRFPGASDAVTFLEHATQATLLGTLVVGFCQGTIVGVGTAIAGFDSFVLLGFCAFFASFVPFFGTALVWGAALIYCLIEGDTSAAVIVGVTGGLSSIADNLILPTFVGSKNKVHPLMLFIVVLGMMEMIGIWGLFLGPVLSIFATRMIELWYKKQIAA